MNHQDVWNLLDDDDDGGGHGYPPSEHVDDVDHVDVGALQPIRSSRASHRDRADREHQVIQNGQPKADREAKDGLKQNPTIDNLCDTQSAKERRE